MSYVSLSSEGFQLQDHSVWSQFGALQVQENLLKKKIIPQTFTHENLIKGGIGCLFSTGWYFHEMPDIYFV